MDALEATVARAANGDKEAFQNIVRQFQDMAFAYAYGVLGDFHVAEDVAQEAFVECYQKLYQLRDFKAFPSWFKTIVFKHCDRVYRRAKPQVNIDHMTQLPDGDKNLMDQVSEKQEHLAVRRAIQTLPPHQRTVVVLFYIANHAQKEIAQFLDIPLSTVQKRLYDARQKIQIELDDIVKNAMHTWAPSRDESFLNYVMQSPLSLAVGWVIDGQEYKGGTTLRGREVDVPNCDVWFVEPTQELTDDEWDKFLDTVKTREIMGIKAGGHLSDKHLKQLSEIEHLTYLDLSGWNTGISDDGLQYLSQLKHLQHLNLNLNSAYHDPQKRPAQVSDTGLSFLSELRHLKTLKLDHLYGITDKTGDYLADHEDLEFVSLSGTHTGDHMLGCLAGKPHLTHLILGSDVTDEGFFRLKDFPQFVKPNRRPLHIDLMSRDRCSFPTFLMVNLNAPIGDVGLRALSELGGLTALHLFGLTGNKVFDDSATPITEKGIGHLKNMPHLGWLGCCAKICTDDAMTHIAQMKNLRALNCQNTVATDQGFANLSQSQSLEYIWANRCPNITGKGFAALSHLPKLGHLALGGDGIRDADVACLVDFDALTEIVPVDFGDDAFAYIGQIANLERLINMYCNKTTDLATEHIGALKKLKVYEAWSTQITDRSCHILSQMPTLENVMFFSTSGITDVGLSQVATLPHLKAVTLDRLDQVTPEAVSKFQRDVQVTYNPM